MKSLGRKFIRVITSLDGSIVDDVVLRRNLYEDKNGKLFASFFGDYRCVENLGGDGLRLKFDAKIIGLEVLIKKLGVQL
jgi:hypothetical protein